MDTLIFILNIMGYASSIIVISSIVIGIVLWVKGIFPVLLRLGNGLARKKIAIFAKNNNSSSLKNLLIDSGLFSKNNIYSVTSINDIGVAENKSIYLVFWHDWQDNIDEILSRVKDNTALIVYAPQELGFIPKETMAKLNGKRNVVVTNFRGRLLNDITTSIITTSYK
ncbi:hypothetical protein KAR28_06470 [Candidatus Parcubacteria bacterium]|nr:hypothetical protein [Candidatus Parcubacteria bacterium]